MGGGGAQDRRYQVFVSSTFRDLQDERQEVMQALLELDCFPAGMELFPASDDEKWELIKSVIDDSDYYIVIVGGRYGSTDEEGISYTEKEYDYALSVRKPVLGFLHANPDDIPKGKSEMEPEAQKKLTAFREKVEERMCKLWSSPEDLGSKVSRSLVKLIKSNPAVGWIRASNALTPEYVAEVNELRRQLSDLEMERERTRTSAPSGTEQFKQGDDEIEIEYTFLFREREKNSYSRYSGVIDVEIDELFGAVGPSMFDEASEDRIDELLADVIYTNHRDEIREDLPAGGLKDFELTQHGFDKIKVQLVALRLIEKSDKKHGVHDTNTYWRLTPYGETYVMSLHAERRDDSSGPVADH